MAVKTGSRRFGPLGSGILVCLLMAVATVVKIREGKMVLPVIAILGMFWVIRALAVR